MRRAALLYNPIAGQRRSRRLADVEAAAAALRGGGVEALCVATHGPGTASGQALELIAAGFDSILACGGDGTVHEVMQGMVAQRSQAALGMIPVGTGNALAADIGLPKHAVRAARVLLAAEPRRIAVGRVEWASSPGRQAGSRYFIVTAGVGADAAMLDELALAVKERHGMAAYYWQALRLFFSYPMTPFVVDIEEPERRSLVVAQVLATRIANFGGLIRRVAPGADLLRPELRLVLFTTPRRDAFLRHAFACAGGRERPVAGVEIVSARKIVCRQLAGSDRPHGKWPDTTRQLRAQADGELIGGLPVRMSVVPDALTLLMPARQAK
ncbi:MAG TPA: diacylglycerol kinase family protein [Terriglobales bacterium]|nr:diacylglycerol kinase family protein [Terriglobales bacterium]